MAGVVMDNEQKELNPYERMLQARINAARDMAMADKRYVVTTDKKDTKNDRN